MDSRKRCLGNIKVEQTVFFLCDMQEKFKPVIAYFKEILEVAKRLVCNLIVICNLKNKCEAFLLEVASIIQVPWGGST